MKVGGSGVSLNNMLHKLVLERWGIVRITLLLYSPFMVCDCTEAVRRGVWPASNPPSASMPLPCSVLSPIHSEREVFVCVCLHSYTQPFSPQFLAGGLRGGWGRTQGDLTGVGGLPGAGWPLCVVGVAGDFDCLLWSDTAGIERVQCTCECNSHQHTHLLFLEKCIPS